jgi:hypothetical protein
MKTSRVGGVVVCFAIVALVAISANNLSPSPVAFKQITRQSFLGTLSWLFIVALFLERAVEVIISTLRDAEASVLESAVDAANQKIADQAKIMPGGTAYLKELQDAQRVLLGYRTETKEIALCTSFVLGLFVSLAGVRALDSVVNAIPAANWLFSTADIVITGAVLAGGSDAIHQMVNVFTNFMDSAAEKAKG